MAENGAATACASDLRSSHRSLWSKPRTGRVVQAETVDETLQAAVDLCVELIDGCNVANDLRDDQRWPGFARHAIELGVPPSCASSCSCTVTTPTGSVR